MVRINKLSSEDSDDVLKKPFEIWPEPSEEARAKGITKRGPLPWHSDCFNFLQPWSKRLLNNGVHHACSKDRLIAYSGSGSGKCWKIDTPILMYDGYVKSVQDILVGDLLMGPDSKPRLVTSLARGYEEMFKITPTKGDSFTCNRSHILSLKTSGWRVPPYWDKVNQKKIETLTKGEIINISVDEFLKLSNRKKTCLKLWRSGCLLFEEKELPIDPYLFGIWLGDGDSNKPSFTSMDKEIVDEIYEFAAKEDKRIRVEDSTKVSKAKHYHIVNHKKGSYDNSVLTSLRKLEVVNNKHVPHQYLMSSKEQRLALLAGLLDSDGYLGDNYFEISQKSDQLAKDILFLCRSLGFATYCNTGEKFCIYKGEKRTGIYHRITISGAGIEEIPTRLPRKQARPRKQIKDTSVTGFTIESEGNGEYYGFTLEGPDRLFLLGDFTVGHNTVVSTALNLWFLTKFPGCMTYSGAYRYNTIEEIQIPIFKSLLSIRSSWDHPMLEHVPNKQDKWLSLKIPCPDPNNPDRVIYKVSTCFFGHLSDFDILKGKTLVYASAEELSQCKDPRMIDELDRRLRSPVSPYSLLFATTNPPESMSHFLYNKWTSLHKWMPDYEGEPPKPKLCNCQYCPECEMDLILPELWEWAEDGYCSNPNCIWLRKSAALKKDNPELQVTRFKRPTTTYADLDGVVRDHICPGSQDFWRVLHPSPQDNYQVASTMMQGLKAGQDEATFRMYAMGEARALTTDKVYYNYSYAANSLPNEIPIDNTKDIYWTHDHNNRPRCSTIIQEYATDSVLPDIVQVDEIVEYDTKIPRYDDDTKQRVKGVFVDDITNIFIKKYQAWNQAGIDAGNQRTVWLHGDHVAWNQKQAESNSKNEFQIMKRMLLAAGFKVVMAVIKYEKVKIQISVKDRLALMNTMLRDENGYSRFKINKHCLNTHKSFADLEKKNNDREAIDKSVDELARRTTNPNAIHLISHVTDAIGYYFCRKFNLVKNSSGELKFVYITDQALLDINKDGSLAKRLNAVTKDKPKRDTTKLMDLIKAGIQDSSSNDFRNFFGL